MRSSLLAAAMLASLVPAAPGRAAQRYIPIMADSDADIQTNLISQFPVGVFTPSNSLSPAVTFKIAKARPKAATPTYNFWDDPDGTPLTLNVSVAKATFVYTLMNAYSPSDGQTIATVEFKGSKGADQTFSLVAGTNIRDFCVGDFANSINGTTTQNAYEIDNVQDACGTGNVKTGLVTDYHIDEQQFALAPAFAKQKLTQIIITPTGVDGSRPIVLGVTVVP
jgi:hypothetical protein